jgi:hypothetical protein
MSAQSRPLLSGFGLSMIRVARTGLLPHASQEVDADRSESLASVWRDAPPSRH